MSHRPGAQPDPLGEPERSHLRSAALRAQANFGAALNTYRVLTREPPLFVSDPTPPQIRRELFSDARLVARREDYLDELKGAGTVVEVGTAKGAFAKLLLERVQPTKLIIIDVMFDRFDMGWFRAYIEDGLVEIREGNSWQLLSSLEDASVNFIYIDASHEYDDVKRDAEEAHKKVVKGGHIAFNDYMNWSYLEGKPYGVMVAANELANTGDYDVAFFAINNLGYSDLVLRRR
jgi:SAM-dependent methyltransferase